MKREQMVRISMALNIVVIGLCLFVIPKQFINKPKLENIIVSSKDVLTTVIPYSHAMDSVKEVYSATVYNETPLSVPVANCEPDSEPRLYAGTLDNLREINPTIPKGLAIQIYTTAGDDDNMLIHVKSDEIEVLLEHGLPVFAVTGCKKENPLSVDEKAIEDFTHVVETAN